MIDNTDDVRWVQAQQPSVEPPDAEATGWARAALMAHAERSSRLACVESPPRATARTQRRRKAGLFRSHRGIAAAAAVAVIAAAGIAVAAIGFPHGGSDLLGPAPASAAILTLADKVRDAPLLTGDATLVQHTNASTEGPGSSTSGSFTGADLYLDDGRYYYASTAEGLPDAVKGGPVDYSLKAAMDAMSEKASADPQVARAAFLKAIDPQWGSDTQHGPKWQQDNVIWCSAIDLLGAACGRPGVLAATLGVLSTVDGVTVKHVTFDGHDALQISMKDPGSKAWAKIVAASPAPVSQSQAANAAKIVREKKEALAKQHIKVQPIPPHLMTLTVDDSTGALLLYTDVGLKVTYHVTRVDAAAYGL
jgi:hypothetical protein